MCAVSSRCMLFRNAIVLVALDPNREMVGLLLIKKRFEQPCSPSVVTYSARLGAISRAKTKHPSNFQLPNTPTLLKSFQGGLGYLGGNRRLKHTVFFSMWLWYRIYAVRFIKIVICSFLSFSTITANSLMLHFCPDYVCHTGIIAGTHARWTPVGLVICSTWRITFWN